MSREKSIFKGNINLYLSVLSDNLIKLSLKSCHYLPILGCWMLNDDSCDTWKKGQDEVRRAHAQWTRKYARYMTCYTFYNVYFINCNYMYAFAFSCPTCKLLTQMLHKKEKKRKERTDVFAYSLSLCMARNMYIYIFFIYLYMYIMYMWVHKKYLIATRHS